MTEERIAEMQSNFWSETNEEWTQEWREELTPEEAVLADQCDCKSTLYYHA